VGRQTCRENYYGVTGNTKGGKGKKKSKVGRIQQKSYRVGTGKKTHKEEKKKRIKAAVY